MCGIVGYIGGQQAAPLLLEGLARLEHRGYDSAELRPVLATIRSTRAGLGADTQEWCRWGPACATSCPIPGKTGTPNRRLFTRQHADPSLVHASARRPVDSSRDFGAMTWPGRARAAIPEGPRLGRAVLGLRWRQAAWAGATGPDADVQRASMWVRPRASTTGTQLIVSAPAICDSLM